MKYILVDAHHAKKKGLVCILENFVALLASKAVFVPPGFFRNNSFHQVGLFVANFANLVDFLLRRCDHLFASVVFAMATAAATGGLLVGLFKLASNS